MLRVCSALLAAAAWTTTSMWASAVDGTLAWSTLTPLPSAKGDLAAVAYSSTVFVLGGFSDTGPSFSPTDTYHTAMEAYDPSTDAWTSMPPMPSDFDVGSRWGGAGIVGSSIYYVGGDNDGTAYSTMAEYKISTSTWASKTPMYVAQTTTIAAEEDGVGAKPRTAEVESGSTRQNA